MPQSTPNNSKPRQPRRRPIVLRRLRGRVNLVSSVASDRPSHACDHPRMPPRGVYSRARGPLPRLAAPISARSRVRRVARFVELAGVGPETRIVDIGCGSIGLRALAPELNITGVDLQPRPEYPGPFVQADAAEHLPFEDGAFEIAYVNSVIEHVPPERRRSFAQEVRRVARGWFVQTPAMSFPVEPHCLLPAAHWLPRPVREVYWQIGAGTNCDEIALLRRSELEALFGPAVRERLGPLTKSWISITRPVA